MDGWEEEFRRRGKNGTHSLNGLLMSPLSAGSISQANLGLVRWAESLLMRLPESYHSLGLGLAKGQLSWS